MIMSSHSYTSENLPTGLIALKTEAGKALLDSSETANQAVIDKFQKQIHKSLCGPVSLLILINAMNVAYRVKMSAQSKVDESTDSDIDSDTEKYLEEIEKRLHSGEILKITEEEMRNFPRIKDYLDSVHIDTNGLYLSQLQHVADLLGFGTDCVYATSRSSPLPSSVELDGNVHKFDDVNEFRKYGKEHINKNLSGLIVNFDMHEVGYKGFPGHFSPLAAYNNDEDMFLVMDTWPDTPSAWIKTDILYKAMCSVDIDSNAPRGLLKVYELL